MTDDVQEIHLLELHAGADILSDLNNGFLISTVLCQAGSDLKIFTFFLQDGS